MLSKNKRLLFVSLLVLFVAALAVVPALAQGSEPPSPFTFTVTADLLIIVGASALALGFDYLPFLAPWYDKLSEVGKRQLMGGLIVGSAVVIFLGQCFSIFTTNLTCTTASGMNLLYIVFLAIGGNQGVHSLFKPTAALKARMFRR